jgi:hypothetical protein
LVMSPDAAISADGSGDERATLSKTPPRTRHDRASVGELNDKSQV